MPRCNRCLQLGRRRGQRSSQTVTNAVAKTEGPKSPPSCCRDPAADHVFTIPATTSNRFSEAETYSSSDFLSIFKQPKASRQRSSIQPTSSCLVECEGADEAVVTSGARILRRHSSELMDLPETRDDIPLLLKYASSDSSAPVSSVCNGMIRRPTEASLHSTDTNAATRAPLYSTPANLCSNSAVTDSDGDFKIHETPTTPCGKPLAFDSPNLVPPLYVYEMRDAIESDIAEMEYLIECEELLLADEIFNRLQKHFRAALEAVNMNAVVVLTNHSDHNPQHSVYKEMPRYRHPSVETLFVTCEKCSFRTEASSLASHMRSGSHRRSSRQNSGRVRHMIGRRLRRMHSNSSYESATPSEGLDVLVSDQLPLFPAEDPDSGCTLGQRSDVTTGDESVPSTKTSAVERSRQCSRVHRPSVPIYNLFCLPLLVYGMKPHPTAEHKAKASEFSKRDRNTVESMPRQLPVALSLYFQPSSSELTLEIIALSCAAKRLRALEEDGQQLDASALKRIADVNASVQRWLWFHSAVFRVISNWNVHRLRQSLILASLSWQLAHQEAQHDAQWGHSATEQYEGCWKMWDDSNVAIRISGKLESSLVDILCLLYEAEFHKLWIPFIAESKMMGRITHHLQMLTHYSSLPWPLKDRETALAGHGIDASADPRFRSFILTGGSVPPEASSFFGLPTPPLKPSVTRMHINHFALILTPQKTDLTHMKLYIDVTTNLFVPPRPVQNWIGRQGCARLFGMIQKQCAEMKGSKYEEAQKGNCFYDEIRRRVNKLNNTLPP